MSAALRERIQARAQEFEVLPLLRVLARLGYAARDVVFAAHPSAVSPAALVHALEFRDEPERHVRIVLNLGLTSAQGLLPSYLQQRLEAGDAAAQSFQQFLDFFEHALLSRFVAAAHPEIDGRLHASWQQVVRRHLQLVDFGAPAGLHWLFSVVFPELGVAVEKRTIRRMIATRPLRLGGAPLGEVAFGERSRVPVTGLGVIVFSDEERTASGAPWAGEVRARLDALVLPLLAPRGVELEVDLVVRSRRSWARLDAGTALGFEKVFGAADAQHRVRLFSGRVTGDDGAPAAHAR